VTTLPEFITFTGADDSTSIHAMRELAAQYPIEWGILFSPTRRGQPRYPSTQFLERLLADPPGALSAHLCGGYSGDLMRTGSTVLDDDLVGRFRRAQINTTDPHVDAGAIQAWAHALCLAPILQCRERFPFDPRVEWLFDASGGRGIEPTGWPEPLDYLHGYAGGLNPDNVVRATHVIGARAKRYWIDMETGVRNEHDGFDLERCRRVCEAVYRSS
jgi:hypothetical protein